MTARLHVTFTGGDRVAAELAAWLTGAGGGVDPVVGGDIEAADMVIWFIHEIAARDAGMRLMGMSPQVSAVRVEPDVDVT